MRASRINSVPSSIFRNSRQYLHSNQLFHEVLEGGHHFSSGQQSRQQQKNKNSNSNKQLKQNNMILNKSVKGIAMKGLLVDCNEMLHVQNSIKKRATKISQVRNRKAYLNSYRSSV